MLAESWNRGDTTSCWSKNCDVVKVILLQYSVHKSNKVTEKMKKEHD